jgi:hypothetical protein
MMSMITCLKVRLVRLAEPRKRRCEKSPFLLSERFFHGSHSVLFPVSRGAISRTRSCGAPRSRADWRLWCRQIESAVSIHAQRIQYGVEVDHRRRIRNALRAVRGKNDQSTDLGHCRPGTISRHHFSVRVPVGAIGFSIFLLYLRAKSKIPWRFSFCRCVTLLEISLFENIVCNFEFRVIYVDVCLLFVLFVCFS